MNDETPRRYRGSLLERAAEQYGFMRPAAPAPEPLSTPEEEPLTLTEISLRLRRTPGSTKDYLSWLEDVDLVTSRQALAAKDHARAIRHAKRASEFAQLGLEQLAYPAVK